MPATDSPRTSVPAGRGPCQAMVGMAHQSNTETVTNYKARRFGRVARAENPRPCGLAPPVQKRPARRRTSMLTFVMAHPYLTATAALVALAILFLLAGGVRVIGEDHSGLVIKRFGNALAPGRLVACNGEAGYQSRLLPPGWHFGYMRWRYKVQ